MSSSPVVPKDLLLPDFSNTSANLSIPFAIPAHGPIPTAFQVRADTLPFKIPVSEEAVFVNTVEALKEIAPGDFGGSIPLVSFRSARYPQPLISLFTPDERNIKTYYVIWGLVLAVTSMFHRETFEYSHFTLLWNGVDVGGIGFGNPRMIVDVRNRRAKDITNANKTTEETISLAQATAVVDNTSSRAALIDATPTTILTNTSNSRLFVDFRYFGDYIGKSDMFISLLGVLAQAAIPPADAYMHDRWSPNAMDTNCKFFLVPSPRETPPFLLFFWLIEAVARAAEYIVYHHTYRGLNMLIKVDDVLVGRSAFIFKRNNTLTGAKGST